MVVHPYVFFEGRCEEAIEFYKKAVGARVGLMMRFKESPDCPPSGKFPPEMENKVMHATVRIGDSTVLMSDGRCGGSAHFAGFSLTLYAGSDEEATRLFGALSEGGKVTMALAKTFFASIFGMLIDRFGVAWTVIVEEKMAAK